MFLTEWVEGLSGSALPGPRTVGGSQAARVSARTPTGDQGPMYFPWGTVSKWRLMLDPLHAPAEPRVPDWWPRGPGRGVGTNSRRLLEPTTVGGGGLLIFTTQLEKQHSI